MSNVANTHPAAASVGFIGAGAMGLPMARNALAVSSVVVYDPDERRSEALARFGAQLAASPRDVADRSRLIIVMVATPAQLEEALFGKAGAVASLGSAHTLVIMSSVGVTAVQSAAARLEGSGVQIVDAPVTGGVARAETAELTVLAAGEEAAIEAARATLATMSAKIAVCGPAVGDGQAVKLVNQLLCSVHLAAAAEALSFAGTLGLEPATVLRAIETGAASSFMLSDRGPRMLAEHEPPVLSAIDIFVKDTSLVLDAARAVDAPVPFASLAASRFTAAHERGWGRRDDSTLIDLYAPDDRAHEEELTA